MVCIGSDLRGKQRYCRYGGGRKRVSRIGLAEQAGYGAERNDRGRNGKAGEVWIGADRRRRDRMGDAGKDRKRTDGFGG